MKRALSKATPVLKPLFGAGILAWMAVSGKLDLAQIARGLAHKDTGLTGIPDTPWRTPASGEKDSGNPSSEEES
jgi:hypothetical protein